MRGFAQLLSGQASEVGAGGVGVQAESDLPSRAQSRDIHKKGRPEQRDAEVGAQLRMAPIGDPPKPLVEPGGKVAAPCDGSGGSGRRLSLPSFFGDVPPHELDLRGGDFGDKPLELSIVLNPLADLLDQIDRDIDGDGLLALFLIGKPPGLMPFPGGAPAVRVPTFVSDADKGSGDEGSDASQAVQLVLNAFPEIG